MSEGLPTVRFSDTAEPGLFMFGGVPYDSNRYGGLIVRRADLRGCIASDLEATLAELADPPEVFVTDDSETAYDEIESPATDVVFAMSNGELRTRVTFRVPDWVWDGEDEDAELADFLAHVLAHHSLSVIEFQPISAFGFLWLEHRKRDVDLGVLLSGAEDVLGLLDASRGGQLTVTSTALMVRSGRVEALVGQREGMLFDAKTTHYDLEKLAGKVSLGQAVARFCNGDGGILVVGLETAVVDGVEVVARVKPVPLDLTVPERYRKLIDQHVYPFPEGLVISAIPMQDGSGMTVLVEVPPQPDYNKPYLVSGAFVDGKAKGEFISIVQRRDDGSEPLKASMIHAWIATGRALIQRGELPASDSAV
ncbi:helix-turn-helix domain-containing protein [Microbacterium sp. PA5]|uniref:AlbA family DNA-binding domain-containing protein n=1 Tax=Microbacterium sp. PA5 TaxID=3416654 RepID=UPI003CF031AC